MIIKRQKETIPLDYEYIEKSKSISGRPVKIYRKKNHWWSNIHQNGFSS